MPYEIDRRVILGLTGHAIAGVSAAAQAATQERLAPAAPGPGVGSRPNIVMFMPDELRADALACYGNPVTKTPNFDLLANTGTRFSNCHVQFSVCGASRCSLLTGWPASVRGHRSLYYFLRPEEPNLFRYLRQAGYDVYWFGKNDALAAASFPDSVTAWSETGASTPTVSPYAALAKLGAHGSTPGSYSFLYPPLGDRRESNDYALVQAAITVLQRRERDRPFCIFIAMGEPHPPYTAPADFYGLYDPADIPPPTPPGAAAKPSFHAGIREAYNLTNLSPDVFRKIRSVYYGQVSYSDWLLGEVLAAMDKSGRDKDTAVFVLSDHGDYAGDYGLVEKWPSGLEDALTHVPLIARVPGVGPAAASTEIVELYDVMQTCLDLAGVQANHTHFARSLLPQLHGLPGDPMRAAFAEGGYNIYEPQCFESLAMKGTPYDAKISLQNEKPQTVSRAAMVRTRDFKLISRPNGQSELYDCRKDPAQNDNLFGRSKYASVQAAHQQRLLNWYINTSGVAPLDKDPRGAPRLRTASPLPSGDKITSLLDH